MGDRSTSSSCWPCNTSSTFLLIMTILPMITFGICYALAFTIDDKTLDHPVSFMSTAIDYAPSSMVGAFGITVSLFFFVMVALIRFKYVEECIRRHPTTLEVDQKRKLERLNRRALYCGWLAALGADGVVSFQYHHSPIAHRISAATFFVFATSYTVIQTYFGRALINSVSSSGLQNIRVACAVLSPIMVVIAVIVTPILNSVGILKWYDEDSYSYSLWDQCIAGVEIMLFVAFLVHFITYIPSFGTFSLRFHLHFDEIDHEPEEVTRSLSTDPTIALLRGEHTPKKKKSSSNHSNGKQKQYKQNEYDDGRQSNGSQHDHTSNGHAHYLHSTASPSVDPPLPNQVMVGVAPHRHGDHRHGRHGGASDDHHDPPPSHAQSHPNNDNISSTSTSPMSGLGDHLDDRGDPFLSADLLDGAAELTGELPSDAQQLAKHVRSLSGDRHYQPRSSTHTSQTSSRAHTNNRPHIVVAQHGHYLPLDANNH